MPVGFKQILHDLFHLIRGWTERISQQCQVKLLAVAADRSLGDQHFIRLHLEDQPRAIVRQWLSWDGMHTGAIDPAFRAPTSGQPLIAPPCLRYHAGFIRSLKCAFKSCGMSKYAPLPSGAAYGRIAWGRRVLEQFLLDFMTSSARDEISFFLAGQAS